MFISSCGCGANVYSQLPTSVGRAWHGAELLPMFGSSEEVTKEDSTWQERSMGTYLRGAWAAFASCPTSGLNDYGWPEYSVNKSTLILLGQNNRMHLILARMILILLQRHCPSLLTTTCMTLGVR